MCEWWFGAKIAGPTVLARKDPAEVRALLEGHGYDVIEVEGDDLPGMHHRFADALARAWASIRGFQVAARDDALLLPAPEPGPEVPGGVALHLDAGKRGDLVGPPLPLLGPAVGPGDAPSPAALVEFAQRAERSLARGHRAGSRTSSIVEQCTPPPFL